MCKTVVPQAKECGIILSVSIYVELSLVIKWYRLSTTGAVV